MKQHAYKRRSNIVFQEVEGSIHILDEKNDSIVSLNSTATFLWKKLSKPVTIENLVQSLTSSFEIGSKQAKEDVNKFIRSMSKLNFLTKGS